MHIFSGNATFSVLLDTSDTSFSTSIEETNLNTSSSISFYEPSNDSVNVAPDEETNEVRVVDRMDDQPAITQSVQKIRQERKKTDLVTSYFDPLGDNNYLCHECTRVSIFMSDETHE